MTSATVADTPALYGYDGIGNSTNWPANSLNQYAPFGYDADGNMTQCEGWEYAYDAANQLSSVSSNGAMLVANEYDAKSRRVRRVTPTATHAFFYDDWNLVKERTAYTNGATSTIHYIWGKDLSGTMQGAGGVGGLLCLVRDGAIYIPCYDNNGNITRYLDSSGDTVAAYTYDAFGNTITQSGSLADSFKYRFSTKYYDAKAGLYYYGYRFYRPKNMRWLNRDSIGELVGFNLYLAFNNNSINAYDVFGFIVLKSSYNEDSSLEELKEIRSWLMSIPPIHSLGDYQQALDNLQFWFNVDEGRPDQMEINKEWLSRQNAVKAALDRLVKHFISAGGDKELGGKSGCKWAHDQLKDAAVGTVIGFPEGIVWQASVSPGPHDALYPAMGGFHFDGTGHFKIRKLDEKGNYEFIGSVDVSFTDKYDWHTGLGILVPLGLVNELKNPTIRKQLGIEGRIPNVINITDGALLKLKNAGLGRDYEMNGKFTIERGIKCCAF